MNKVQPQEIKHQMRSNAARPVPSSFVDCFVSELDALKHEAPAEDNKVQSPERKFTESQVNGCFTFEDAMEFMNTLDRKHGWQYTKALNQGEQRSRM